MLMSSHVKLRLGSKVLFMVARRNLNNPMHVAAHSIKSSNSVERLDLMRRRIPGVIGSLVDGLRRLQPLSSNWRRGVFSKGLLYPESCAFLLSMYVVALVWCSSATNRIRVDSDAGSGAMKPCAETKVSVCSHVVHFSVT